MVRPFSRNAWEPRDFFVGQARLAAREPNGDFTVPAHGTHILDDYLPWEEVRSDRRQSRRRS